MTVKNWFTRTKTHDCLILDEVPDGMPVIDGEWKKLPLDGDAYLDSHLGLMYTKERSHRSIRITKDDGTVLDLTLIAKRSGTACGLAMVREAGQDRVYQVAGQTIPVLVDDLVLKMWTDPATNYNILDNTGLKGLLKQNLLGFEMLLIFTIGGFVGFISYPIITWLIGLFLNVVARFLGG